VGSLQGGGNSWYARKTGLGCATIVNIEVVLADGQIVDANASSNKGLYKALKGGPGNFGIVTRFDVKAFPYNDLCGGGGALDRIKKNNWRLGHHSAGNFGNNNEQNP
jgi:hypothetical protein